MNKVMQQEKTKTVEIQGGFNESCATESSIYMYRY